MSTRDYVKVAAMLRKQLDDIGDGDSPPNVQRVAAATVEIIARELADIYVLDNPHFDRTRFLRASGIGL